MALLKDEQLTGMTADQVAQGLQQQGLGTYTGGTFTGTNASAPIAIDALTNSTKVVVPQNPTNPYTGLGSSTVLPPPPTYTPPPAITAEDKYASDLAGLPQAQSQESLQAELDKKYQIEEKTKTVNALKAQIDTNTAEAQAAQLAQEGRQTSFGAISGAQRDIDRQLAIKNLPLTAQYQAALGDLQGAQASVDKLFTAKLADAEAQYKYKKDLIDSAYAVASKKEQKLLDAKLLEEDRKYKTAQDTLAFDREKEMAKYNAGLKTTSTISPSGLSTGATAVIGNPNLLNSYTATEKGKIINELVANGYDTSNLGVKPLDSTAITKISDTQKALNDLETLKTTIQNNLQYIGPITGLQALNPWSKARQVQADVDRVKQTVGKALEGGVLRKEDEEKYKKILATLTDTPETALYKLDSLTTSLTRDIENYTNLQLSSGKTTDITKSLIKKGSETTGKTSTGNSFTITQK